ncbi:3461_t:CDS:2, partial [Racocetra persica]
HENSHLVSHHCSIWIDSTPCGQPVTEQSSQDNESNSQDVLSNRISNYQSNNFVDPTPYDEPLAIEQSYLLPSLDHQNNSNQFIDTTYNDNESLNHCSNSQDTLYETSSCQLTQFLDPVFCSEQSLNVPVVEQSSCPISINNQSNLQSNTCEESSNIQQGQFISLNTGPNVGFLHSFTLVLNSSEVDDSDESSEIINNNEGNNNVDDDYEYAMRLQRIYNEELNIDNAQVISNFEYNHNQEDLHECNMQGHDNLEESSLVTNCPSNMNDDNESCSVMPVQNWHSSSGWDEDLTEQPNSWNEEINNTSYNYNDSQTIRDDDDLSWGWDVEVNDSPSSLDGDVNEQQGENWVTGECQGDNWNVGINDPSNSCNDTSTVRDDDDLGWGWGVEVDSTTSSDIDVNEQQGDNCDTWVADEHQDRCWSTGRSNSWWDEEVNDTSVGWGDEENFDETEQSEEMISDETVSKEFGAIISEFRNKLVRKHPSAYAKVIELTSRNHYVMFSEFIDAIKQFDEKDFIYKPRIKFEAEPVIDAGGVFNDTMRQILETFLLLENPEYGGDGHLFTGDNYKLISSTAPIHFMDELDVNI